jgi:integrase
MKAEEQRMKAPGSTDTASWSVAELMRWWLTNYSAQTLSHSKTVASVRKHLLTGPLSEIRLRDVTSGPIVEFLQEKSKSLAPQTVNHLRKFLVQAFAAAVEAKRWHENPAREAKRRKVPKRKSHNYLRTDEVGLVFAALDARWRSLFLVSVCLGLRRGEALGLLKRHVDLARKEITVERSWENERTKGDHTEVLPIPDALVPWVKQAMDASPSTLVFPGPKGGMMSKSIRLPKMLRGALARAGITTGFEHRCRRHGCDHKETAMDGELRRCPVDGRKLWPVAQVRKITWHDLRHSTATLLKVAGVHLVDAQQILRHADPRTTQAVYTHVDTEALRPRQ